VTGKNPLLDEMLMIFAQTARDRLRSHLPAIAKNRNIYKYETKFLDRITNYPSFGGLFINAVLKDLVPLLRDELKNDFTFSNLQHYKNLQDKKVIDGTFLQDRILIKFHEKVDEVLSSGRFANGYVGSYENLRAVLVRYITGCYRVAYNTVYSEHEASTKIVSLDVQIRSAAAEGLPFKISDGKLGVSIDGQDENAQRLIHSIRDTVKNLDSYKSRIGNEHPRLYELLSRYSEVVKSDPVRYGDLFLFGGDIQAYAVRYGNMLAHGDAQRGIAPLDPDFLSILDSLMLRHNSAVAGIDALTKMLTQYERVSSLQTGYVHAKESPIPKIIEGISINVSLFNTETRELALHISQNISNEKQDGETVAPTVTSHAAALGVTRGSLSALGEVALSAAKDGVKDAIKDSVSSELKNPELWNSARDFLWKQTPYISTLAERLPAAFGWATALYRMFGNRN